MESGTREEKKHYQGIREGAHPGNTRRTMDKGLDERPPLCTVVVWDGRGTS